MFTNCIKRCINGAAYNLHLKNFRNKATFCAPKWPWFSECSNKIECSPEIVRNFSIVAQTPVPGSSAFTTNEDIQYFLSLFPEIVNDLTKEACEGIPDCKTHYEEVLNYNMANQIHGNGSMVASCYKILESPEKQSPENIRLAHILGWCPEIVAILYIMQDDIMEQAETRFNQICWYKYVGLNVLNDANLLEQGSYIILRKYFSNHHCYVPLLELVQYTTLQIAVGQLLDIKYTANGVLKFTKSKYNTLAKYKAGYYGAVTVRLAMYLANICDAKDHKEANSVLLNMGHLIQLDNDISDWFEDNTKSGKVSSDIWTGQCTWLIIQALERASPSQKKILEQNYGKGDLDCSKAVLNVYEELDLFNVYLAYKKQHLELVHSSIKHLQNKTMQKLFYELLEKAVVGVEKLYLN